MARVRLPLLVCCWCLLAAAEPELPPSPASHPGLRILPAPAFTHWPAIAYPDETRNAAFAIPFANPLVDAKAARPVRYAGPVPRAGAAGAIGWAGRTVLPFHLPVAGEGTSGLIDLVLEPGTWTARLALDGLEDRALPLRIADAREPWPCAALRDGYPVDAAGVPVVLLDRRRQADQERKLALLRQDPPRGEDRAVLVGDPLAAFGEDAWQGLDALARPAADQRFPEHAALVALAQALNPVPAGGAALRPRTIVWSPGNQVLAGGAWSPEEERLLAALRSRCEALALRPRLVLALPPLPVDGREQAEERRDLLRRSANQLGWVVLDLARAAGDPEQANRLGEQVFATYPVGAARERMRAALASELAR